MRPKKVLSSSPSRFAWVPVISILALVLSCPVYASVSLAYTETKGPFKNWTQVVDLDGDGKLDVLVSHTRWEEEDLSWAGVGRWINHGDGRFEFLRDEQSDLFAGYAAGAGDADSDGDADIFVQGFGIRLLENQGGQQGGETGKFMRSAENAASVPHNNGYQDMGGTVVTGDLNGDSKIDAVVTGCCYGLNPTGPGYDYPNEPSISWVWINDGEQKGHQTGHVLPMEFLDGYPIRETALGDLDRDGDLDVFAAVGKPTIGTLDSLDDLILLNDGTGRLSIFEQQLGNTDSTSVALGDVNGDAYWDTLVGTSTGASVWINRGSKPENGGPIFTLSEQSFDASRSAKDILQAGFSAAADKLFGLYFPYGSIQTKAVFLADLDGDADQDALIARLWGAEIWWNDGQGGFQRSGARLTYKEDIGVAVGDFDGDGDQDIFAGNNDGYYRIWFNDGNGNFSSAK